MDISNDVSSTKESLRAQMAQSTEELRQFHDNIELSWQDINVFAPVKKKGCGAGRLRKKKQELIPPKQILSDSQYLATRDIYLLFHSVVYLPILYN